MFRDYARVPAVSVSHRRPEDALGGGRPGRPGRPPPAAGPGPCRGPRPSGPEVSYGIWGETRFCFDGPASGDIVGGWVVSDRTRMVVDRRGAGRCVSVREAGGLQLGNAFVRGLPASTRGGDARRREG